MESIFEKIKHWIIKYQNDIILIIGVILISLFSFAVGYIVAKKQEKEPIRIEKIQTPIVITLKDQKIYNFKNFKII